MAFGKMEKRVGERMAFGKTEKRIGKRMALGKTEKRIGERMACGETEKRMWERMAFGETEKRMWTTEEAEKRIRKRMRTTQEQVTNHALWRNRIGEVEDDKAFSFGVDGVIVVEVFFEGGIILEAGQVRYDKKAFSFEEFAKTGGELDFAPGGLAQDRKSVV